MQEDDLRTPDRIYLMSPAVGITPFARASNWHKIFSWIPYFEKSKWLSIDPEYDPFKYNSFPKNAGAQNWLLTKKIQAGIKALQKQGRMDAFPPVTAFQSLVDSTVVAKDLVTRLFDLLAPNGNELVVFDVNQIDALDGFWRLDHKSILSHLLGDDRLPFRFTLITNASPGSLNVVAKTKPPQSVQIEDVPLDLAWPHDVYSLAHVAIPFPPDDPLYGRTDASARHGPPHQRARSARRKARLADRRRGPYAHPLQPLPCLYDRPHRRDHRQRSRFKRTKVGAVIN